MTLVKEKPFMLGYLQEFRVPRPGGRYDPELQVRFVKVGEGEVPFVETNEMSGMGSTKTGERAGEH